ncbi:hypothetical protein [Streptomyces sp. NBC_01589]
MDRRLERERSRHHWALATGRLLPELRALADLAGLELVEVTGR